MRKMCKNVLNYNNFMIQIGHKLLLITKKRRRKFDLEIIKSYMNFKFYICIIILYIQYAQSAILILEKRKLT
jgi:hypothetical protein